MLNVLVVDDSMVMRKKIISIINDLGHQVAGEAANGEEAIKFCEEVVPDFITMDITMPIMNGIEATKILKKKYPTIKIVMLTSHGQENLVRDAIKSGAKGYILKPVSKDKIEDITSKIFKIKKIEDTNQIKKNKEEFYNGLI